QPRYLTVLRAPPPPPTSPLSLHDALPISALPSAQYERMADSAFACFRARAAAAARACKRRRPVVPLAPRHRRTRARVRRRARNFSAVRVGAPTPPSRIRAPLEDEGGMVRGFLVGGHARVDLRRSGI